MTATITPELLADLRASAEREQHIARPAWIDPEDVLAILDRIEALEKENKELLETIGDLRT